MLYITSRRRTYYELLQISKTTPFNCNNNLYFKVYPGIFSLILAKDIQRCIEQKKLI